MYLFLLWRAWSGQVQMLLDAAEALSQPALPNANCVLGICNAAEHLIIHYNSFHSADLQLKAICCTGNVAGEHGRADIVTMRIRLCHL